MWRVNARGLAILQRLDPLRNAVVKIGVGAHRVVDTIPGFEDAWQDVVYVVDRERIVRFELVDGTVGPGT